MKINRIIERVTHNWPAKILSILAAVTITFFYSSYSNVSKKYINVPLHLDLTESLTTSDLFRQTAKVSVSGQSEDIFQIDEENIYVYADFSEYFSEGEYKATVKYYLQNVISDDSDIQINVEPSVINVKLETRIKKFVSVEADISGFPKTGYDLIRLNTKPEIIEIIGPERTLDEIDIIKTSIIDISGLDADFSFRLPLIVPQGNIIISEGTYVEIYGSIGPTMVVKTFDDIILFPVNLSDNLGIKNTLPQGIIKVRGNQNIISELDNEDFTFMIDCLNIKSAGKYTISVVPVAPTGIEINIIDPEKITIEVFDVKADAGLRNQ